MVKLTVRCASQPAVAAPRRVAPTTLSPAERLAAGERLKKSGNDAYGRGDAAGAVERWVEAVDALRGAGGAARLLGEPAAAAVAVACLSNCARARLELRGAAGDGDGAAAAALEDANGALALVHALHHAALVPFRRRAPPSRARRVPPTRAATRTLRMPRPRAGGSPKD